MNVVKKEDGWINRENYRKKVIADQSILGEGRVIQIVEVKPGDEVKTHKHNKTEEIFFILSSAGKIIINGNEIETTDEQLLVCNAGDSHSVVNDSDETLRILVFKYNFVEDDTEWLKDG